MKWREVTSEESRPHHLCVPRRLDRAVGVVSHRSRGRHALGGTPRGRTLVRNDGFGVLKQMFARGYAEGDAAQVLPRICARPDVGGGDVAMTFAEETGRGFYDQIEDAEEAGDVAPFFDFTCMPDSWQVPAASPRDR